MHLIRNLFSFSIFSLHHLSSFSALKHKKFKTLILGFDYSEPADRQLVMNIAIKCADISNGAKKNDFAVQWSMRIMEEFFLQVSNYC